MDEWVSQNQASNNFKLMLINLFWPHLVVQVQRERWDCSWVVALAL